MAQISYFLARKGICAYLRVGSLDRGQIGVGPSKMAILFSLLPFDICSEFSHTRPQYIVSLWWFFIDTEIDDLEWPFYVKL